MDKETEIMKRILLALPASFVLFACADDDAYDPYDETVQSAEHAPAVTDPTVADAETRFQMLSAKAERLVDEVSTRSADVEDDLDELVDELDDQREDATERLSELSDASTESLASAGDAFENALDELEAAIDRLDRRLREEA
jgi:hypothetical protein